MIDFFAKYETYINFISILGFIVAVLVNNKRLKLKGFIVIVAYSTLMLNTFSNILVKGF